MNNSDFLIFFLLWDGSQHFGAPERYPIGQVCKFGGSMGTI